MIKEPLNLDNKDREILSLLEKNPELSQKEISTKIGLSQPSVSARLYKLKKKGVLSFTVGVNFKKVNLYLAKVDVSANNTLDILNIFKDCPYFLNGLITSGKNNLCLFFAGEDITTLEAIVDGHLRNHPYIKNVDLSIVISPFKDLIFPLKMSFIKKEVNPCHTNCDACPYFTSERCLGCPILDCYKGELWKE
ncbi:MAG: Lrp/AsnC family transcriptional regulator [Methanosarcinales archaeon]